MNILTGNMADLTGTGLQYKSSPGGGNGLLTGLTEAWEPAATILLNLNPGMVGQKTGLDTDTSASLNYVAQAGFPTGHALQATVDGVTIKTPADALLSAIGVSDFLYTTWLLTNSFKTNEIDLDGDNFGNGGFEIVDYLNASGGSIDVRGSLSTISSSVVLETTGRPALANTPMMLALWYTTADTTLHLSVNGGTVFTAVNGTGPCGSDANELQFDFSSVGSGAQQQGPANLWQGTDGVANAVSQLATLYGSKLKYSDFT